MDLEAVRVRDCTCPGTPHPDGDEVYLLPTLGLEGGAAAELDLDAVKSLPAKRATDALLARWTVTFVRYGAVGWNWLRTAAKDQPSDPDRIEAVPFDVEILCSDYSLARLVAVKANDLYSEAVTAPLREAAVVPLNRQQRRSRRGQTGSSTSAKRAPTSRSSRSSSQADSDGPPLRIAR